MDEPLATGGKGAPSAKGVRVVGGDSLGHRLLAEAVPLGGVDRGMGAVDRQLVEVGAPEAGELGIEVREIARLKKRVVGEVDPAGNMSRAEGDLLGLGEVVGWIAIERQATDDLNGGELLGDQLRRIREVDPFECLVLVVREDLDAEVPLGKRSSFDGIPEVPSVKVGIDPAKFLGLLPHE